MVYCNHSIIITRDVDLVPPGPMAVISSPVDITKEDEEEASGVASKPLKAHSHANTPPPADETNGGQNNVDNVVSITVEAPAPMTAVDDKETNPVVGGSRRQSLQKNAGIFCTPQFHREQLQSTQQTGFNNGHTAVAQVTTYIDEHSTWEEAMDSHHKVSGSGHAMRNRHQF